MLNVGIDEVGRGCLAGPVVAGAVSFPRDHVHIPGITDSKLLSSAKRAHFDTLIRQATSSIGIGVVEANEIDEIGIVAAVSKAMHQACLSISPITTIKVDGPFSLGLETIAPVESIVHGDRLVYEISAASIVAKVFRDNLMIQRSFTNPAYGWDTNMGYGTAYHIKAIKNNGLTSYHRRTFIHL
jgi:ribonuclease HII